MQRTNPTSQDRPAPNDRVPTWPFTLAVFGVFVLVAAAAFLPRAQLWGVNHLAFYSVPVRVAALVLIALAFVPPVSRRLYGALIGLSKTLRYGGGRVDVALMVIAVGSVVMFSALRTSTNLLGDGQLIAQSFDAAWEGNEIVIMRNASAIVAEERVAPGATLAYYGAAKLVTRVFDKGPVWGVRFFNCLLGAFFVYIILGLLRKGPFSLEIRLWLMVLTLFSSTMLLFFGYIENYTPLVFAGFLYVIVGFMNLHQRAHLWLAIVLFVVAFYMHIQAVLFAPSLLYLILWKSSTSRRRAVESYAVPALTAFTVVAAVAAAFTPFGQYYLPLRGNDESYGLFSPIHFADILNEILILMPILPLFVVMAWTNRARARSSTSRRADSAEKSAGATGWFAMTAEWQFASLLLVPCIVYLLLFNAEIGMARDWDLFTMTTLGLVPMALIVLNRFFRSTRMDAQAGSFSSPAIVICVILGVAWIGINASTVRSTVRFERILEYDQKHAAYAYENLSIFYYVDGKLDRAAEVMEKACEISANPRQKVRLAMYYDELGKEDAALDLMRLTVTRHPTYDKSRFYYVAQLEKRGLTDEMFEAVREGVQYQPTQPIYWYYYGEFLIQRGNVEEGIAAHRRSLTLDPPPEARIRSLEQIQRYEAQRK